MSALLRFERIVAPKREMEEKGENAEPFAEAGEVDGERICEKKIVCVGVLG